MTKYLSKFKELAFYVVGVRKQFTDGVYETNKAPEIEVLDKIADAQKQAEPKPSPTQKVKAPAKK